MADAPLAPGHLVLDVGAGHGVITATLVEAGVRVVAVELHPGRVEALRSRFAGEPVTVVRADAADLKLPRRPFHVVASPPFGHSSALVRRLMAPGSRLVSARLILQRQAAHRWAGPTAPGRGRWARTFTATLGPPVPRRAFRPPPQVDAQILRLDRH